MKGKIIENISNLYRAETKKGIYDTTARGKFKNENQTPVVGDNVEILVTDEEKNTAVIEKILPRNVFIKRPKLANITQMIFVLSSKHPKPDLQMLDKQLAFAEFLGIKSVIVLNKIDLDQKEEFKKIKKIYEQIGYTVIETIAKEKKGINELAKILKNNINAFSGNSGVGKSTLINSIFDSEITQEGKISERNKRGKNTTTSTRLYKIDENTYIADTPGFSTFDISEINYKKLDYYYKEFKAKVKNCEYVGCTHIKEEQCGVKKAIEQKKIDKGRYDRFCKIYNELKEKEKHKY